MCGILSNSLQTWLTSKNNFELQTTWATEQLSLICKVGNCKDSQLAVVTHKLGIAIVLCGILF